MTLSLTKPVAGQEFQQFPFPLNFLRKLGRGVVLDWQIFQSLGREKFVDAIFPFLFFWWLADKTKTVSSFNYIPPRMERVRLLNIFALERKIDSKSSWDSIRNYRIWNYSAPLFYRFEKNHILFWYTFHNLSKMPP